MKGRQGFKFYGGSATSGEAISEFMQHYSYKNSTVTASDAATALQGHWKSRGIELESLVELSEVGTAYGLSSVFPGTRKIGFPRDWSVLRRAYESDQQLQKSLTGQRCRSGADFNGRR